MNTLVNIYQSKYKNLKIYFFIISILLFIINSKDKKIKDLSFIDCLLFLSNIVIGYLIYNEYLNKDNTTIILTDLKNYQRSIDSRLETINSKNTQLSKSILPKKLFMRIALLLFASSIGTIAYKNKDSLKLKSNDNWTKVFTIGTGNSQDKIPQGDTPQSDTSESLLEEMVSKNIQSGFSTVKDNPVSSFFGTTTLGSLFALKKAKAEVTTAKAETATAKEAANAAIAKADAEISKLKNAKVIPQMIRNNKFKLFSGLAFTFLSGDLYHATEKEDLTIKFNLDKTYSYQLKKNIETEMGKRRDIFGKNPDSKLYNNNNSFNDIIGRYLTTPITKFVSKETVSSNILPDKKSSSYNLGLIGGVKPVSKPNTQVKPLDYKGGGKLSVKKIKSKNDVKNKSQKNNSSFDFYS